MTLLVSQALLEERTPLDGQRGYVFNNKEAPKVVLKFMYTTKETSVWGVLTKQT